MNKRLFPAFAVFFALMAAPSGFCDASGEPKGYSLTLEEAINMAFRNNKDIRIQEEEIRAAQARIMGAYGRFLPALSANAGYKRNGAVLKIASAGAKKDQGIFSGYKNDNTAGVSLNQTIYDGGADYSNYKQAQINLSVQRETLRARKLDTAFETKRLYYGLLLAYETERIAGELVSQAEAHYQNVKRKFEQGTASKFDLLQSRVQVSKLAPELVKARNSVDSIAADLKKLLALKMQDNLELKDKLIYLEIKEDEAEFLKDAYLNRPEMSLKSFGVDINKWQISGARAQGMPQLAAGLDYDYRSNDPGDMFNSRHNSWSAGFSVSIPIFDAFSTRAKVREAKVRYAQAILEKEDLGEQIAVDIRKGCLDLKKALSIIAASRDEIEEAREALRIAEVSFDNGEGTNLDVLDSQVSLSQIEKNYSEAVYDYLMAVAFISRSIGNDYRTEEENEKTD